MKKALMASVLSIFLGVGVLFGGCGTDLSGLNSQINELKQQIASLNQTILELQTELQNATGDISSLQSQLAIASANYDKLYNQVYGIEPTYKQINEQTSYSFYGIKLFDFTPTSSTIGDAGVVVYFDYKSNIQAISDIKNFGFNAILYTENTNLTYEVVVLDNNGLRFSPNDFDNSTTTGIMYLFIDSNIFAIYKLNFV